MNWIYDWLLREKTNGKQRSNNTKYHKLVVGKVPNRVLNHIVGFGWFLKPRRSS